MKTVDIDKKIVDTLENYVNHVENILTRKYSTVLNAPNAETSALVLMKLIAENPKKYFYGMNDIYTLKTRDNETFYEKLSPILTIEYDNGKNSIVRLADQVYKHANFTEKVNKDKWQYSKNKDFEAEQILKINKDVSLMNMKDKFNQITDFISKYCFGKNK